MKNLGNIILALLLTLISITADATAVRRILRDRTDVQIGTPAPAHEFVLVKTAQLPDLFGQEELEVTIHPPVSAPIVHYFQFMDVAVSMSNTSFMAGRNCLCIPLRL